MCKGSHSPRQPALISESHPSNHWPWLSDSFCVFGPKAQYRIKTRSESPQCATAGAQKELDQWPVVLELAALMPGVALHVHYVSPHTPADMAARTVCFQSPRCDESWPHPPRSPAKIASTSAADLHLAPRSPGPAAHATSPPASSASKTAAGAASHSPADLVSKPPVESRATAALTAPSNRNAAAVRQPEGPNSPQSTSLEDVSRHSGALQDAHRDSCAIPDADYHPRSGSAAAVQQGPGGHDVRMYEAAQAIQAGSRKRSGSIRLSWWRGLHHELVDSIAAGHGPAHVIWGPNAGMHSAMFECSWVQA